MYKKHINRQKYNKVKNLTKLKWLKSIEILKMDVFFGENYSNDRKEYLRLLVRLKNFPIDNLPFSPVF